MSTRHIPERPAGAACTAYPFARHFEGVNALRVCRCLFCRNERFNILLDADWKAHEPAPAQPAAPPQFAFDLGGTP